ncbi:MAG: cytosine permease [Proteobacteria bacterium]|uniref:Cytosine permease n=1 Tax=Candidatus Avisuccinivibrio stercorigallinarum TaxID=2840704 RepID=A0A9D9D9U0_9GAMM|nr:cytosine permease [Candidatus Avisuccinivibrio stercorigallinarum]
MSSNNASSIEQNGINPIPDAERYGKPSGLFPVWFSWNISIFGITCGMYVFSLGLSVWQAMAAGVIGYFLSCSLVGILAVGSVRTGLPTLAQSRMCFGTDGNRIPAFFGYVANMGWKVTMLSMASTTLADLLQNLMPALSDGAGHPGSFCLLLSFAVVIVLTMVGAVYGYALIIKVERWIAIITGVMTFIYLFFFIPQIDFSQLNSAPSGSLAAFIGGIVLAMTMVGLGFLNYGGDYSRYLPRNSSAGSVIFWTTTGIALPVSVLLILGVMLCVGNPELLDKAAHEPLAALTGILPFWFYVPFSLVIIISLISAGMTGVYSSGLALLAVGVPLSRAATTLLNAVIIALGCFYLTFISDSFLSTFSSFLASISVVMGSWGAIEMVDLIRQRALKWDVTLAMPAGQGGSSFRAPAMIAFVIAVIIGLGTITSTDPYIAKITSFLLSDEAAQGTFAKANVGLVAAMLTGGVIYAFLTFVVHMGYKKQD